METNTQAAWRREQQFAEERDRAQAGLDDINDLLAKRQTRGASAQWTPPAAEPPRPRAQPQPKPRPEPSPPEASKVTIPTHDPNTGRVVAVHSFEGRELSAGLMWSDWVRNEIRTALDRRVAKLAEDFGGGVGDALRRETVKLAEEVADDVGALQRQINEQSARIAGLELRLKQAEARTAGGPRLVEDDAAD